ncbi:hypothetical protein LWI28_010866 [Acer negundo]|uniref:Uncharacterized protein n=1 Tax=Acer negundo TaxID=4023 RepID=A0AAD5JF49_ACENE|nr:hypothetical protein LWI28_010866 [Acer negundo]KAK4859321.1 hypothetical protein QYF36_003537 [Acer negundo]
MHFTLLQSKEIWGHLEAVNFLMEKGSSDSVVAIAKNSAKSALHSATRNGHVAEFVQPPGHNQQRTAPFIQQTDHVDSISTTDVEKKTTT